MRSFSTRSIRQTLELNFRRQAFRPSALHGEIDIDGVLRPVPRRGSVPHRVWLKRLTGRGERGCERLLWSAQPPFHQFPGACLSVYLSVHTPGLGSCVRSCFCITFVNTVCMSVRLSQCFSVSVPIRSVWISACLSVSRCLSRCFTVSASVSYNVCFGCLSRSVSVSRCLSVCLGVCLGDCLVSLTVSVPSVSVSVSLSVCLGVSVYVSVTV